MQSLETQGALRVAAARRPEHAAYWSRIVGDLPDVARFHPDSFPGEQARHQVLLPLEETTVAAVRRVTRDDDAAIRVLLTVAVAAVLRRHVRQDLLAVALVPSSPTLTQALVVPLLMDRVRTLRSTLIAVGDAVALAEQHADFPIDILGAPSGQYPFADVLIGPVGAGDQPYDDARFGVTVSVCRDGDRLALSAAASDSYSSDALNRVVRQVRTVLAAAVAQPDAALWDITLLDDDDRAVAAKANETGAPLNEAARVEDMLRWHARNEPDRVAVIADDVVLSYGELDMASDAIARRLVAVGVSREDLVVVLAERGAAMLTGVFGILKAGAAYVPVDPGYPIERIRYMLEDSAARVAVTTAAHATTASGLGVKVILADQASDAPDMALPVGLPSRDLAYVIYTSGSTGTPKGVQVEHRSVVNRIAWMQNAYPLAADDVLVQKTPVSFDVSVWELFWWSFAGARVVLPALGVEKDPEALADVIERHHVTTIHFVPSMLSAFLGYAKQAGAAHPLRTLRRVFASGEALGRHHVDAFHTLVAPSGGCALVNLYGPTEATVDVSHYLCSPGETGPVPIGAPIENLRLHVVDEDMRPQPVGVPGELLIAGAGLARGYLHRPDLTRERFVRDVVSEAVAYRSGDLARRRPDGSIEYLGRIDQQVKVRGHRIELGEVEAQLRAISGVNDAIVVPRPAPDGQLTLWGYVVGGEVDADRGRAELGRVLPDYMIPAHIIVLAEFPLTPSGKLDRNALPADAPEATTTYIAPRTAAERTLARIWAEVLGLPQVGVDDNFFALGGNSIHFVTVLARARAAGLTFTFQDLFRQPTIAGLCGVATLAAPSQVPVEAAGAFALVPPADIAALPVDLDDAYPMTQLQVGLVFETELDKSVAGYHDILLYTIASELHVSVFEEAVAELVRRAPILRTSYDLSSYSTSLQLVHREAPSPLRLHDLRSLTLAEQEVWYADWIAAEKADRFAWDAPGLVRIHVHLLTDGLFRYGISQHNSALDGWSITVLHTTLFRIYADLLARRALPAPQPGTHLRDYVSLELRSLAEPTHREFWRGVLDGAQFTAVPRSTRAAEGEQFEVVFHEVDLTDLSASIKDLARRCDVPVKNVLMAAHVAALAALSGVEDILTGYEHSGRPETEGATEAIGLFLNTIPFRARLGDGTWADLLRAVHTAEADLLPARRYPMAQMKADMGIQAPLFETVFNFTHFTLLRELDDYGFSLLDVRANSETEFVLRAEFSQHFRTDEIRLSLHYHTNVISGRLAEVFARAYRAALQALAARADERQEVDKLLDDEEQQWLRTLRTAPVPLASLAAAAPSAPPADGQSRQTPATPTELRIAAAWADVLGLEANSIRLDDNFFLLGGTSLAAMRLAVELGGIVGIADIMRNSGLAALSRVADERSGRVTEVEQTAASGPILQCIGGNPVQARLTLVCFPYAGGGPTSFDALGQAIQAADPTIAVCAVALPGHDVDAPAATLAALDDIAQTLVAEIQNTIPSPVAFWGHCVGSALAVRTASILQEDSEGITHLFIGGKLLYPEKDTLDGVAEVRAMSDDDAIRWLADATGLDVAANAGPDAAAYIARVFRHDAATHNHWLAEIAAGRVPRLNAPLTVVLAADDPLTKTGPDPSRWSVLSDRLAVTSIPVGGHYFCEAAPDAVAAIIVEHAREGQDAP